MKPRRASSIPRQPPFAQTDEKGDFGGVRTEYQVRRAEEIQELARLEPPTVSNDLLSIRAR
jgi:hypothetical protein